MMSGYVTDHILKRDRLIVTLALFVIAALAWFYMVVLAVDMDNMSMDMSMPMIQAWGFTDFMWNFVMWSVMMVAMMIPSAAPMILSYAAINRRKQNDQKVLLATFSFMLGYLTIWTLFSAVATALQGLLHSLALLSSMMVSSSPILGGVLLVSAGIFQFTPYKNVCLRHCRTPMGFLLTEWRLGNTGAFIMGIRHGYFCVGCCWLIMALLFVAGVMNLLWVAVLAIFVLLEKLMPAGLLVSRTAGTLMIVWGIGLLLNVA